jgi:Flp pilus assembly pilin Flp
MTINPIFILSGDSSMFITHRPSERGQGLVEYALILVLVATAIIIILSLTGKQVAEKLCDVVIQIGGSAPDSVEACRAPRVMLEGIAGNQWVSNPLNVEAVVKNNHGLMTSGVTVNFYIDGVLAQPEHIWRYCLGGDNDDGSPCHSYGTTVASGQHTLDVIATDSSTGLTGETIISFNVN